MFMFYFLQKTITTKAARLSRIHHHRTLQFYISRGKRRFHHRGLHGRRADIVVL